MLLRKDGREPKQGDACRTITLIRANIDVWCCCRCCCKRCLMLACASSQQCASVSKLLTFKTCVYIQTILLLCKGNAEQHAVVYHSEMCRAVYTQPLSLELLFLITVSYSKTSIIDTFFSSSSTSMDRERHTSSTMSTTLRKLEAAPCVWVKRARQRLARRPCSRTTYNSMTKATGFIFRSTIKC